MKLVKAVSILAVLASMTGCAAEEPTAESVEIFGSITTVPRSANDEGGLGSLDLDSPLVDGGPCKSKEGFDDIAAGSQVTVRDPKGEIVAIGSLEAGIQTNSEGYKARDALMFDLLICTFSFSLEAPAGKGFYTLSVGNSNRGEHTYAEEELPNGIFLELDD